jgi:hypothetical protein
VSNNKDPNQKQPGEREPGKYHYNPGNMSGKTIGTENDGPERSKADAEHSRVDQQDKKRKNRR